MSKTIILIRNVSPEKYGGGESSQLELAKVLEKQNYQPIIFTTSNQLLAKSQDLKIPTKTPPYLKNQNWSSWRNLFLPAYIIWQIRLYFWYKKQFHKIQPAAVNIESRDDWIAATIAAKKLNIKTLWTDHADLCSWVLQNVNIKYKNFIGKYILHLAKIPHRIIMVSATEKAKFQKLSQKYHLTNVITIKNGTIDKKAQFRDVNSMKQSFCYVGRIVKDKGIAELISAFQHISQKYPKASLDLYGEGEDERDFIKLANDNPRIIFHGYTAKPLAALAKSAIFVLPSYHEGLSISLIEAMMMQKAIIATDIANNKELISDQQDGLLVPRKNIDQLAKAMEKLLQDSKLTARLAQNARQKYEQEFDLENIVKTQFIPLIQE